VSSESPEGTTPTPDPGTPADPGGPLDPGAPPLPESAPAGPGAALTVLFATAQAAPDPESDGWTVSRLAIVGAVGMLLIAIGALAAAGGLILLRGPGSGPVSAADRALLANPGAGVVPDVAASPGTPPTGAGVGPVPGRAKRGRPPAAPVASSPVSASPTPGTPGTRTCTVLQQSAAGLGADLPRNRVRWIRVTVTSATAQVGVWRVVFHLPAGELVLRVWNGAFRQNGGQVTVVIGREHTTSPSVRGFAYQVSGQAVGAGFALNGGPCGLAPATPG